MKNIYLDYAATTPLDKKVYKAMKPYFSDKEGFFGNPSSLHKNGQRALHAIDEARDTIAQTITAHHDDIIFTGSATEANNLIIRGTLKAYFRNHNSCKTIPEIIVSSIEHPSILETVKDIEKDGSAKIHYLSVTKEGVVDTKELRGKLNENTILVSVMWVNNETGVIQPISKIAKIVSDFKNSHPSTLPPLYPIFHTDAVQAFQLFDLNVIKSGVDAMTLSAHKIYGPKGIGCLYLNSQRQLQDSSNKILSPMITGGGQEQGIRSGTEHVAGIVGFAQAADLCQKNRKQEYERQRKLLEDFFYQLKKMIPDIEINGTLENRSPHILNLFIPRLDRPTITLDAAGLSVSTGSACAGRRVEPSRVLRAMGHHDERISRSVRMSIGRPTTKGELMLVAKRIAGRVAGE